MKEPNMISGCFGGRCGCCECRGQRCFVYHEGHDHRITRDIWYIYKDALVEFKKGGTINVPLTYIINPEGDDDKS